MSVLTERQHEPAIRFLTGRAESLDEMKNVRPGEITGAWMPEYRLERAPIPIENLLRCRHVRG